MTRADNAVNFGFGGGFDAALLPTAGVTTLGGVSYALLDPFADALALDATRTVQSITRPDNPDAEVYAATITA